MGKEYKKPYFVNMNISIEKMKDIPEGTTPASLFFQTVISSIILVSKQSNGMGMQDQRRLYSLRNTFENAIASNETDIVEVEHDDFKFLMRCWEAQRQEATYNEQVIVTEAKLKEAEALYSKE